MALTMSSWVLVMTSAEKPKSLRMRSSILGQHGRGNLRRFEHDVATLDVGLNLLEPQRGERFSQPVHPDSFVPAHVDPAQHCHVNRHSDRFLQGYEIFPNTAARLAPVAEGRFDGR